MREGRGPNDEQRRIVQGLTTMAISMTKRSFSSGRLGRRSYRPVTSLAIPMQQYPIRGMRKPGAMNRGGVARSALRCLARAGLAQR
jgi:hypothetical protein